MKLNNFRRINKQDYSQEEQTLVEKLAGSINSGFEVLYEALNRKVSLRDNLFCNVKEVDVIVDSSGIPTTTTIVTKETSNSSNRIDGVSVIDAVNTTNPGTYPTSGVFVSKSATENGMKIEHVTGLQAGNKYRLKLVLWLI